MMKKLNKRVKEMLNDDDISFDLFYRFLREKDIGNWDNVNNEDIIKEYCCDMIKKGVHVWHIVEALEKNPSDEELYKIWLGNSMLTPEPINTKKELYDALDLYEE